MKVILITDVKKVGQRGSVVDVADGYAMNVLIPQKKALPATADNLKRHEKGVAEAKGRADQSAAKAREILADLRGKTLSISAKASETGTLFKSLHESDITAAVLAQWGVTLPESALTLEHPIKQKGTYTVPIELEGSSVTLTLEVK
ncbi:MAG: 50S ribosomal protein L9 [Candidatus Pacebacteria bacterium]|nr:50S ribosomal protein L9 [Candidatus Paceibacterota bacterium]